MSIGTKIFLGVVIFFGVVSGIFLLVAKKKPTEVKNPQAAQVEKPKTQVSKNVPLMDGKVIQKQEAVNVQKPQAPKTDAEQMKDLVRSQWTSCRNKTIPAQTKLMWPLQITEGIPAGGTYAKGYLDGDLTFPVRVIIESDSPLIEKIKARLIVGNKTILRGICKDVAPDGSVILQVF
ncbi:MAG: hypothetical protein ACD_8C00012G0004 [uncultured bacterium]|nr:MAG: hypothetical protein ACD_8C00012G0004 [uncultured bacterium]